LILDKPGQLAIPLWVRAMNEYQQNYWVHKHTMQYTTL